MSRRSKQKTAIDFLLNWTWDDVFRIWMDRMVELSAPLSPLFTEVQVCDPKYPTGRETATVWWPAGSIRERHTDIQRHFDRFPGTVGPINPFQLNRGQLITVGYLWRHRESIEKVAAILIAASLFSRLHSSRVPYPREWPTYSGVNELYNWAIAKWVPRNEGDVWHYSNTYVLPPAPLWCDGSCSYSNESVIDNLPDFVRHLADEHARVLNKYRPIAVHFGPKRDPFVAKILREEYEVEQRKRREWEHMEQQRKSKEKAKEEQRRREHPKADQWSTLSNDELKQLIWSKPTTVLAREFGVSDVAIGKRCKALGIQKPPRGFWRKVETGEIPHPNGKPPSKF